MKVLTRANANDATGTGHLAHTASTSIMLDLGALDRHSFYATVTHTPRICDFYARKLHEGFRKLSHNLHSRQGL